ncbi:MAG: prephenate dehydratase [Candidatus Sericytochromatia bacterium]|nr:prephenate dehydratase [Candidatus Sericytochromatia bacterium]
MEQVKKVAIQGFKASFHEIAAYKYFGNNIELLMCETFRSLFNEIKIKNSAFGVVAIENTVAGTLLPNYALLRNSQSKIIGEVYLQIQQNLMALPNQSIDEIREVHSHPMAILQCQEFFEDYPNIKLIESTDTAISAAWIRENNLKETGAIASKLAAETYNLNIIQSSIETNKKNFTRFLVIQDTLQLPLKVINPNKASLSFHLAHKTGSLANILMSLSENGMNLTKIQSLPLVGREWEYFFHLDLEFDDYTTYLNALEDIKIDTHQLTILGEYKRGDKQF